MAPEAVDAGGYELADFDLIPLRRRHAFPACGGNSGVKRGAAILRQPIAHRDHATQHGWRDVALTRSIPKGVRRGPPNGCRGIQQPADRRLYGGSLAGKQQRHGHGGAAFVRHPHRGFLEAREQRERVAIDLLRQVGDEATHGGGVTIAGIGRANLFD